jgi:methyltransferase (TIGR00027 family)
MRDERIGADMNARDRYVERLVEEGSAIALPELRAASADALYRVLDRGGVGVVAIPEPALVERQLDALARFGFAQYMAAGFIDREVAFRERLDQMPLAAYTSPDTVHFVVFAAATGELLASMCMIGPPPAAPETRVATRDRPLLPAEEQVGWGVFNRLERVPDTPLARIREYARLVKNLRHPAAGPRAVVELILAPLRLGLGAWATAFDIVVGQIEPSRVQRNLEFFHIPLVLLRGALPCIAPGHPMSPALEGSDRYPFAFAVSDLAGTASRLDAIEAALALPDSQALPALLALKRIPSVARSSLLPASGLPAMANTPLPRRWKSNGERRRARELGARLAGFPALDGLSDAERRTLGTFMTEARVERGATIVGRGEVASELVLIEAGQALSRGRVIGPGACLGAGGVLAGTAARASVVANTSVRMLRVPAEAYRSLLRELPEVDFELERLAHAELLRPSPIAASTAETQAALRAVAATESDPALRNPDWMAARLVTAAPRLTALAKVPGVRRLLPRLAERLAPGGYHYETARVKHVDAILNAELRNGLEQLLILGAGYDSRPYRFAEALRDVRVFEVDLPRMSAVKRRKIARLLSSPPQNVTYVEADLLEADLERRLTRHGYDIHAATLVILSGVAPYLSNTAVARLLAFVGRHTAPATSIVFDYVYREMVEGDDSAHGARQVRKRLVGLGEPLRSGIPAGGAAQFVQGFGLTLISDLQPDELAERYLRRADGTTAGQPYGFSALAHARLDARRCIPSLEVQS